MKEPDLQDRILELKGLTTCLDLDEGRLMAVDKVSLTIGAHKTLGLIGESGCGKTMLAKSILQILPKTGRVLNGEILFRPKDGQPIDLAGLSPRDREMRRVRGGQVSMIFQEPMSSLSPVHTIGDQVSEMILQHVTDKKKEAWSRALEMLEKVKISNPEQRLHEYPHQLSGGLRQRVMIAMALACSPQLLIADEPTTALDVTVQSQILSLMKELQADVGMAILFITHDLGVIAGMADFVAVMYLGQVVEYGSMREIFKKPLHPYTVGLMNAVPKIEAGERKRLTIIEGIVPLPINLPDRCRFFERCPRAVSGRCDKGIPELREVEEGHMARCVLYEKEE